MLHIGTSMLNLVRIFPDRLSIETVVVADENRGNRIFNAVRSSCVSISN